MDKLVKMANRKSQMWFTDFVIALVIFSLTLISYYTYTTNISKQDSSAMDEIISDAKTVSSAFTSGGYPDNWNSNTVTRIGFTDNYNRIDNTKFSEFTEINYNKTKKLLGITNEYILFFVNGSGDVQNIEGFCGTGNSEFSVTYDIDAAYYYKDEDKLKQFMIDTFDADIYNPSESDIYTLISNIDNYGLVVIESPEFSTSVFNNIKEGIEDWVSSGGIFMLSARPVASQSKRMLGVKFSKVFGDAGKDKPATVIRNDEVLTFDYGSQIIFNQVYYIIDDSIGSDLIDIARFNESDIEIEDIMDNKIAIARWPYGDGKAFFFSDFDAEYMSGNFLDVVGDSTKKWVGASCLPINISNVERANLVKVERMVIYNSKQIKMMLYLLS